MPRKEPDVICSFAQPITSRARAITLAGLVLTAGLAQVASAQVAQRASSAARSEASAASLDAWRDHIRPCEAERAWERIGWHASFADGLRAANTERRPLLLWMMNGHPLGCT